MPSGAILGSLIQTDVNNNMGAIAGTYPLSTTNPSYFIEMCNAIGNGLITGGPTINFTTQDTGDQGSPNVQGTGTGIGIIVDDNYFKSNLYSNIRNAVLLKYPTSLLAVIPTKQNNGLYLQALCNGVASAITTYYSTAWNLNSIHPQIYSGTGLIIDGNFSGLNSTTIGNDIKTDATRFGPLFWPEMSQAIASTYVDTIENHSTGTVTITGTCNSGISQICGLSGTGTGTGVAS
jgi:hypothetical protein